MFESLQQEHRSSIAREEERGLGSFESRQRAIERVGLPEVRQYQQALINAEKAEWRNELESAREILPEIRPLILMQIKRRAMRSWIESILKDFVPEVINLTLVSDPDRLLSRRKGVQELIGRGSPDRI